MDELDKIVDYIRFANLDLDIAETIVIMPGRHSMTVSDYSISWLQDVQRYQIYYADKENNTYPLLISFDNVYDVVSYIVLGITKRNLKFLEQKHKEQSNK